METNSTIVVLPKYAAYLSRSGNIILEAVLEDISVVREDDESREISSSNSIRHSECDPSV